MKEVPAALLILGLRYCQSGEWGNAIVTLKKLSEKVECEEALEIFETIDPIIYYGSETIPYILHTASTQKLPKVLITYQGTTRKIPVNELLSKFIDAKSKVTEALVILMSDINIDLPSFVGGLK